MATIASLVVDVLANTVQLRNDVDKIQNQFGRLDSFAGQLKKTIAATFTVGAVTAFAQELVGMADDIQRMADKTRMSTDEIQKLNYLSSQTSVSVEGMVSAVQNLQQRLGSGDAGAVGAMKALGINTEQFLALGPYEQFVLVAESLGKIEDPTVQASFAAAIFGKTWKELGPVILANIKQITDQAPLMSKNTIRALDTAGDSLARFQLTVKVWAAEAYNFFGRVMDAQIAAIYRLIGGLFDATARVVELAGKIPGASKVFGELTDNVASLRQTALWYTDAAKALVFQQGQATDATKKLTPEAIAAGKALREQMEAATAAAAAAKRHTDSTTAHTAATKAASVETIGLTYNTEGLTGRLDLLGQKLEKFVAPKMADFGFQLKYIEGIPFGVKVGEQIDLVPPKLNIVRFGLEDIGRALYGWQGIFGATADSILNNISQLQAGIVQTRNGISDVAQGIIALGSGDVVSAIVYLIKGFAEIVKGAKAVWNAITSLFDRNKGRDLVIDFASNLGGFDALHAALLRGGDAGEALWIKLTQGVGRNNPAQARQVIEEVQRFLDQLGSTVVEPQINVQVHYPDDMPGAEAPEDAGNYAATGGVVGYGRILHFRRGGFVPSGTDTVPAMLTPGEIVLNAAQQKNVASKIDGGDIVIHQTITLDGEVIERRTERQVRRMAQTGRLRTSAASGRTY